MPQPLVSQLYYSLMASLTDPQVMIVASTESSSLFVIKHQKEQLGLIEEPVATQFELADSPTSLLSFEGNKLMVLHRSQKTRTVLRPRWDRSVTVEPPLPKQTPSELDVAADFLDKSLTQNRRSLFAFLTDSDHVEILEYYEQQSNHLHRV